MIGLLAAIDPVPVVNQSINPYAVVGALGTLSAIALAWVGYRRATRSDSDAKLDGAIGQIILGLNTLIDQLQEELTEYRTLTASLRTSHDDLASENIELHLVVRNLENRIKACDQRITDLRSIQSDLQRRLRPPVPPP